MISKLFSLAALAVLSTHAFATDVNNDPNVQWEVNSIEITEGNNQRATPYWKNPAYATSQYADTEVVLENKGGYLAQLQLEYLKTLDNGSVTSYLIKSDWIAAGNSVTYKLPFKSSHLKVTAVRKTGLLWDPVRAIVSKNICEYNNEWRNPDKGVNIVTLSVWGTSLHPTWQFKRAPNTYYNGADTHIACANY